MYIKSGLPCKELKSHKSPEDLEEIFLELVLGSKKWILIGGCNPRTGNISYFLSHVSKGETNTCVIMTIF